MTITEEYHCPLTGDAPDPYGYPWGEPGPNAILIPGRILPGPLTDAQAEHERAVERALCWDRDEMGNVRLWVDM